MPTHAEKRDLPYSPEQLFDLVADVERYPEFLPWCLAARIKSREDNAFTAELIIGFKMFRERFTSHDVLTPPAAGTPGRIDITYQQGPFRYLNNHWVFEPSGEGGCAIDFFIDFEFSSPFFQKIIGALFNQAARRMVSAFEVRAKELYG